MPTMKKTPRKKTARRKAAPKKRKVYYCVPCGMEVTVSKAGVGTSTLMCCGRRMTPRRK